MYCKWEVLENVLWASPKSDGHIISPYNINAFPSRKVNELRKLSTQDNLDNVTPNSQH